MSNENKSIRNYYHESLFLKSICGFSEFQSFVYNYGDRFSIENANSIAVMSDVEQALRQRYGLSLEKQFARIQGDFAVPDCILNIQQPWKISKDELLKFLSNCGEARESDDNILFNFKGKEMIWSEVKTQMWRFDIEGENHETNDLQYGLSLM
ncbi:MAG: hypothetical protein JKY95_11520 [Planctomycetaceae bacterium]|nr:hypothetical protein [Planctomycetaceae bacterium]